MVADEVCVSKGQEDGGISSYHSALVFADDWNRSFSTRERRWFENDQIHPGAFRCAIEINLSRNVRVEERGDVQAKGICGAWRLENQGALPRLFHELVEMRRAFS